MENKTLIIGGTGTLGVSLLKRLSAKSIDITVLSRDEQKQYALKKTFPKVNFVLGDIRDKSSLLNHFKNVNTVFHFAALKHIDIIEKNIIESVKTNILGTINSCECATESKVSRFVFSSTDKAVDPINVYGNCKAISEKIVLDYNSKSETIFSVFRWGNILGSSGSAIIYFIDLIKRNETIPLTSRQMSRFFIHVDEAISFVLLNMNEKSLYPKIPPKMKSSSILKIINIIGDLLNKKPKIKIVGLRQGEKIHECLHSIHSENYIDSKTCEKYTTKELKKLLEPLI